MTRTVTGTIYHEYGAAWQSGTVTFTLLETFATATKVYPIEAYSVTTNSSGVFSITLGTPDTGTAHYQVTLPNKERYEFYIGTGISVDLATLITIAGTSVAQDDLQTLLDAAGVLNIYSIASPRVMTGAEDVIEFTSGTFAQNLPEATGSGKPYDFVNSGLGIITLTPAAGELS